MNPLVATPVEETTEITLVKSHLLEIPISPEDPELSHPRIQHAKPYTIIRYDEYAQRVKCDLCDTKDKANNRVIIRNDETKEMLSSGLNCLENHFGVKEKDLRDSVNPIKFLILDWQKYVSKATSKPVRYPSNDEALKSMAEYFRDAASFLCPAVSRATALLAELRKEIGAVSRGKYQKDIQSIQALIGLLNDHRHNPKLLRDKEQNILKHPKITNDNESKAFVRRFFNDLSCVTFEDVGHLNTIMVEISEKKNLPFKISEFPPYNASDKAEYSEMLLRHMQKVSNSVNRTEARHFKDARLGAVKQTIIEAKQKGYVTLSLADADRDEIVTYDLPLWLKSEIREAGLSFHISEMTKAFEESDIKLETGSVASMQRQAQQEEDEELKTPRKNRKGFFRGFVMWREDRWYDAYGLWHKYGGHVEARKVLEDLRSGL